MRSLRELGIGKPVQERVDNLELQVDHHSSIMESEQGTRMRAHQALHDRLDYQDRQLKRIQQTLWFAIGVAAAIQFLFPYIK